MDPKLMISFYAVVCAIGIVARYYYKYVIESRRSYAVITVGNRKPMRMQMNFAEGNVSGITEQPVLNEVGHSDISTKPLNKKKAKMPIVPIAFALIGIVLNIFLFVKSSDNDSVFIYDVTFKRLVTTVAVVSIIARVLLIITRRNIYTVFSAIIMQICIALSIAIVIVMMIVSKYKDGFLELLITFAILCFLFMPFCLLKHFRKGRMWVLWFYLLFSIGFFLCIVSTFYGLDKLYCFDGSIGNILFFLNFPGYALLLLMFGYAERRRNKANCEN